MTVKCIYLEADQRERDYQTLLLKAICSSHKDIHMGRMWGQVFIGYPPYDIDAEILLEFKKNPIEDSKRMIKLHSSRQLSLGSSTHMMAHTEIDLQAPLKDIVDEITSCLWKWFYTINNEKYKERKEFCDKWEEYVNNERSLSNEERSI